MSVQVAPEQAEMKMDGPREAAQASDDWSPIVFVDNYRYCCSAKLYCCPSMCQYLCCPCCCFVHPDVTLRKGPQHCKTQGLVGAGKGVVSYRLHRQDDYTLTACEIFRNAEAVNAYHKTLSCCGGDMPLCAGMTLCFREHFGEQKTYGDPEECKKITHDFGRTAGAIKKGKLITWGTPPFSKPPTKEELAKQWGQFHYGFTDEFMYEAEKVELPDPS
mmetsp:Transcript_90025/g.160274  ORF Transcript_90025/g.160274 Transcript_90025/m.160274 type:complete len:217 (-) Transcript_90025:57-707(-)|eukprot:CAMPEP_0197653688 /NCGR_PEP_ID=MMETSP1338-20131121/36710_1 /TAXON_ID=43686 ORGANISM="Pelagodinium beii, Strain RCC1491" /NCGR_SAMPLE_ID=MMETSP1338 /ASSEMBLY_ACC=CAM_ASM_000754 /LENGTH=216 /DNA_ID=CAMNT_0043228897 /DNA_START=19 /DNA_END=669 /DNA_ORIENTATION=-